MSHNNGLSAAQIADQLNRFTPAAARVQLGQLLTDLVNGVNAILGALDAVVLNKAGLVIKAGASALAKSVNAIDANINGVLITVAASDMAALAGTLATAKSAAWAFYTDASGTVSTSAKTADSANHAAAVAALPAAPAGLAQIGFVVVDNASGAGFVGGTTALDAAGLTTTFYDSVGPVLPATVLSVADLASR